MIVKKIVKFFKILIIIIVLTILIFMVVFSDKNILKYNCGIRVPKPQTFNDVYDEHHPDSDFFHIYSFKESQKSKVSKDLTLITENNKEVVLNELEKYANTIFPSNKEKMAENFDNYLIRENNFYKVLYKNRRLHLVIFDVEKSQLYYFSTIVEK